MNRAILVLAILAAAPAAANEHAPLPRPAGLGTQAAVEHADDAVVEGASQVEPVAQPDIPVAAAPAPVVEPPAPVPSIAPAAVAPAIPDLPAFLRQADAWLLAGRDLPPELPRLLASLPPSDRLTAVAYLRRVGLLEGPPMELGFLLAPAEEPAS